MEEERAAGPSVPEEGASEGGDSYGIGSLFIFHAFFWISFSILTPKAEISVKKSDAPPPAISFRTPANKKNTPSTWIHTVSCRCRRPFVPTTVSKFLMSAKMCQTFTVGSIPRQIEPAIDVDDDQWSQIVKADGSARSLRTKSWPYYESWKIIFGKDRASGITTEDILDAYDNLDPIEKVATNGVGVDYNFGLDDLVDTDAGLDRVSPAVMTDSGFSCARETPPMETTSKKRKHRDALEGLVDACICLSRLGEVLCPLMENMCVVDDNETSVAFAY
ncbi:hypothetical protein AAHA92_10464 [Salvia divinorum]|uniref:Uncharacterized protein n=1 Tax=Salvia divinorum TaxID=28513 RepID=A0ABD1HUR0_SALDI